MVGANSALTARSLLYNHLVMVKLDTVFAALSDPTRRGMLAQLAHGEANVGALAAHYEMSQPAISKHLRVLENAGLVTRTKSGRESIIRIDPRPMEPARDWISRYAHFWEAQFDAVEDYLNANSSDN